MGQGNRHGKAVLGWVTAALGLALFIAVGLASGSTNGGMSSTGGVGTSGSGAFGSRNLRYGDSGNDVRTLNWLLHSLPYGKDVRNKDVFYSETRRVVRRLQRRSNLSPSGVVRKAERVALAKTLKTGDATYYTLFGNRTACGQKLTRKTIGFAVPTTSRMKCGARVVFKYRGHWIRATRIDTGPGVKCFDLTYGLKRALGFPSGRANVRYARVTGAPPC